MIDFALYELDENGEATGTIHTYCSKYCCSTAQLDLISSGFTIAVGESDDIDDAKCEWCYGKKNCKRRYLRFADCFRLALAFRMIREARLLRL